MRLRRTVMLLLGGVAACYAVHVDETQVRAITAEDMDCDEALITLENVDSSDTHVARYVVRGCGSTRTYDCEREDDGHVACAVETHRSGSDAPVDPVTATASAGAAAAAGCACASLFAGKSGDSSDDGSGGGSNPSSTTPASNH